MNLSTLSPSDFESLAADILSTALGVRFERFGEGRDGGIDCQYQHITEQGEERWIGQAKCYKDVQALIRQVNAEQLHPLLPVGPGWAALVTEGDMALLDLSTYANSDTQADIWSAAVANQLNSEDAAALAEFYADNPAARQMLGKKKLLVKQLLSACIDEIAQINDSYHLEAILQDLYRIETALDADIGEPKVMIYHALEPDGKACQDVDDSVTGATYYSEPSLFEGHEQLLNELKGLQAEARFSVEAWLR